jgi:arginase family enzyme
VTNPLATLRPAPDPRDPRAPSLLHAWDSSSPLNGRDVLLGLPYDGGIPSRPGARFGPKAIREALASFGTWDGERDLSPVLDLGDLSLPSMNGAEAHRSMEEAARNVFTAGARPVFLGGDHGCTGSLIRGLATARPDLHRRAPGRARIPGRGVDLQWNPVPAGA